MLQAIRQKAAIVRTSATPSNARWLEQRFATVQTATAIGHPANSDF